MGPAGASRTEVAEAGWELSHLRRTLLPAFSEVRLLSTVDQQ